MSGLMKAQISLPTVDKLGVKVPDDVDVQSIASQWFTAFAKNVQTANIPGIVSQLAEDAFWRDMLSMTWEFRTFMGPSSIAAFLKDQLVDCGITNLKLKPESVQLERPYTDVTWIQGMFNFETKIGLGSGVFRIIPSKEGPWKGHTVYTNLDDLKGFPEQVGPLRKQEPVHGGWPAMRKRESDFVETEPAVVIVGAGQSGLDVAARLKALGIPTLIIEKAARIGDQWRGRYEALCLHDTVCEYQFHERPIFVCS